MSLQHRNRKGPLDQLKCPQKSAAHLIEHSVSKTQELPEEVEPAVQEGKETQQEEHYSCNTHTQRRRELHGAILFWALPPVFSEEL